jgi:hypothetical protein
MLLYVLNFTVSNISQSDLALNPFTVPIINIALEPIKLALAAWSRKSELTADRAGLLAVQNLEVCHRLELKLAVFNDTSNRDLDDLYKQAVEDDSNNSILDNLSKIYGSHPDVIIKIKELETWVSSGKYQEILNGNYLQRNDKEIYQTAVKDTLQKEDIRHTIEEKFKTVKGKILTPKTKKFLGMLDDNLPDKVERFFQVAEEILPTQVEETLQTGKDILQTAVEDTLQPIKDDLQTKIEETVQTGNDSLQKEHKKRQSDNSPDKGENFGWIYLGVGVIGVVIGAIIGIIIGAFVGLFVTGAGALIGAGIGAIIGLIGAGAISLFFGLIDIIDLLGN